MSQRNKPHAIVSITPMHSPLSEVGMYFAVQYAPPKDGGFWGAYEMDFDPKLAILFLLIGAIIGLSHLGDGNPGRIRRQFMSRRWRKFVPLWRKG